MNKRIITHNIHIEGTRSAPMCPHMGHVAFSYIYNWFFFLLTIYTFPKTINNYNNLYYNVKSNFLFFFIFGWLHNIAPHKLLIMITILRLIILIYIFLNRKNILFHTYKPNYNKCLILYYILYINAIIIIF